MEKKYEGIVKQFELSIYMMLTICLLSIYISFTIYQKQKPVRDIKSLKSFVQCYNQKSGFYLKVANPILADSLETDFKNKIDLAVLNRFGKTPDWGLYDFNEDFKNLISLNTISPITNDMSISEIIKIFNLNVNYNFPEKFNCETTYTLLREPDTKTYLNITNIKRLDSLNYLITILIGRSTETNSLKLNEKFTVKCVANRNLKKTNCVKKKWLNNELPWISKNLDNINDQPLSSFNESWIEKIDNETLNEEQILFGLKIQNYSLTIITISLLYCIYIFHLSLMNEIVDKNNEFSLSFVSPLMFKNLWAKFLRVILWIIFPCISILMDSIYISKDTNLLIAGLPIIFLGIIILRKIEHLIKI